MPQARASDLKRLAPTVLLLVVILYLLFQREKILGPSAPRGPAPEANGPREYLLCVWNVENLFDDRDDQRRPPDDEYDKWFATSPVDRNLKYARLTEALMGMNGGKGPDIIALIEVESIRAAELLRDSLNRRLPAGAAAYGDVQMKEVAAGRHIAPAILSRLPAKSVRGFNQYRILESYLEANGKELVVLASHWTSHRSDEVGARRDRYAKIVYGECERAFKANSGADILVCGDFNDEPGAPAVADALHAGSDAAKVAASRDQLLFLNLLAGKDPKECGTHYYNKPVIYDHICVSPGLLDEVGWSCDPNSIQVVTDKLIRRGGTRRQPWRFGNHNDNQNRGYSDHFPVTVTLTLHPSVP